MNPISSLPLTAVERANAFVRLGDFLGNYSQRLTKETGDLPQADAEDSILTSAIRSTLSENPWFVLSNVVLSLQSIAYSLKADKVERFLQSYVIDIKETNLPVTVSVIMAGNVPLVGFHDFFCVVLSGNRFLGKLSSGDKHLLPALARLLVRWYPGLEPLIGFSEGILAQFDAVIATGSNNSSRYFDYYFARYPHIIRKSRNSVAVLNGSESSEDLMNLGTDIFSHFGRGCRNVSQLFLPAGYPPETLFSYWESFRHVMDHHKYRNNYDYHKSVFIINTIPFLDSGHILLKEDPSLSSPIAVLHYNHYNDISEIRRYTGQHKDTIQCIVSNDPSLPGRIPFGKAQMPTLADFADRIDTMKFLIHLSRK